MRLRTDEGRALHNALNPEKPITEMELGMHIYPLEEYKEGRKKKRKDFEYAKYANSVKTSMFALTNGDMTRIEVRRIEKICEVLGIDANFMFGQPSVHDKDYVDLILFKSETVKP